MDGNGKKISDVVKNIFSSSKTGESVGNAKQTIFLFLALGFSIGKEKTVDFSERIAASDLKLW